MSEGHLPLEEMAESYGFKEDMSYECPFTTFTFAHWLEMQAQVLQYFSRFQRAIERNQPGLAALITVEMQTLVSKLMQEACAWIK